MAEWRKTNQLRGKMSTSKRCRQMLNKLYTRKCLKQLDSLSQVEAKKLTKDGSKGGEKGSAAPDSRLSEKDVQQLVSIYDIVCSSPQSKTIMYYQQIPNQERVTDSQASAMIMDEESLTKVIKIEL